MKDSAENEETPESGDTEIEATKSQAIAKPQTSEPIKDKYLLLLDTAANTYENIKFADTKATVLLAIYSAFLGFAGKKLAEDGLNHFSQMDVPEILLVISLLILAAGIICLIFTIWPRAKVHMDNHKGFLHADRISEFDDVREFSNYIDGDTLTEKEIKKQIVDLAWGRANSNRKKYDFLKIAMVLGISGLVSGSASIAVEVLQKVELPSEESMQETIESPRSQAPDSLPKA
ncbi:hypothetical protein [Pelagicoccus albus]|uniref:Pycsar effector protein domain-containing protein n=1 Tax=Pelagicoccus albus TaxID=415222 RepID=A0A7X1B8B1_9BACT|nr:hypothetical protein [Pelagicoccus albus]MBC2607525.1 hypothetical protein [Pelagicoccus albus]